MSLLGTVPTKLICPRFIPIVNKDLESQVLLIYYNVHTRKYNTEPELGENCQTKISKLPVGYNNQLHTKASHQAKLDSNCPHSEWEVGQARY